MIYESFRTFKEIKTTDLFETQKEGKNMAVEETSGYW